MENVVIFTDLDGTLLDDKYDFKKARKALDLIRKKKIPLVICTSKVRAEIELYRKKLKNNDPFISENGGAIFIPKNYFKFDLKGKENEEYFVIELGKPYNLLMKVCEKIRKIIPIKSFYMMSSEKIAEDSGLSLSQAKLAKKREYDIVFKIDGKNEKMMSKLIKENKLNYTKGGRYFHLIGKNSKGKAVKKLTKLYRKKFGKVKTIGLGDSENDFSMLKNVDKGFLVKGPEDWNKIILDILK